MSYMEMTPESGKIIKSLWTIQNDLIAIKAASKGQHNTYTSYEDMIKKLKPLLTKNNVLLLQPISALEDGTPAIVTIVIHESGEYIKSFTPIKQMESKTNREGKKILNEAQEYGGGITFTKRYALSAFFAWATGDHDIDSGDINKQNREKTVQTKLIVELLDTEKVSGELRETIINDLDMINTKDSRARVYNYLKVTLLPIRETHSPEEALKAWNAKLKEGLMK